VKTQCRVNSVEGKSGRVITGRLLPGSEMFEGIIEMCKRHNVKYGYINCAIGSLEKASFVSPITNKESKIGISYCSKIEMKGPIEFFGEQGIICQSEDDQYLLHLHGSFSTEDMKIWGGHMLATGNIVLATLDVVITEVVDVKMLRVYDEETGFTQFCPKTMEAV